MEKQLTVRERLELLRKDFKMERWGEGLSDKQLTEHMDKIGVPKVYETVCNELL